MPRNIGGSTTIRYVDAWMKDLSDDGAPDVAGDKENAEIAKKLVMEPAEW